MKCRHFPSLVEASSSQGRQQSLLVERGRTEENQSEGMQTYDWLYSLARVTSFHQCMSADDRQNQEQMHLGPKQEMCDSSEFE